MMFSRKILSSEHASIKTLMNMMNFTFITDDGHWIIPRDLLFSIAQSIV